MLKRTPADFQVAETLEPAFLATLRPLTAPADPAAPAADAFVLCRLTKETLSTPEAVGRVAKEFKLRPGTIAYAGLKDKHARTVQHVTIKLEPGAIPLTPMVAPGLKFELLGQVPRALASSDIARNAFTIVLRNLTEQDCFDMDTARGLLAAEGAPQFVNYFGDQRFGSARHGQGFLAKHLIKGEFETALKLAIATEARKDRMQDKIFKRQLLEHWGRFAEVLPKLRPCRQRLAVERLAHSSGDFRAAFAALPYIDQQLSVYAYQSHLWNSVARKLVETICAPKGQVLAAADTFGELLFPEASAVPQELSALNLPLFSRKTELIEPFKAAAESVLEAEGIALAELQIPGLRRPFFGEEPRHLFVRAENFKMGSAAPDETALNAKRRKRTLSFELPRGAYATVLLRALGQ